MSGNVFTLFLCKQMAVFNWIKKTVKKVFFLCLADRFYISECIRKKKIQKRHSKTELEDLYSTFKKAREDKSDEAKRMAQPLAARR